MEDLSRRVAAAIQRSYEWLGSLFVDDEIELALRVELDETRERLRLAQRELFDCRARLALIGRLCLHATRVPRVPGVLLGAVRAAVFSSPPNVRLLHRRLSRH